VGCITGIVNQVVENCEGKVEEVGQIVRGQQAVIGRLGDQLERVRAVREVEQGDVELLTV
jgi:hypothetical protein